MTRVLAVASGGGHWVQLLRLRPAFEGAQVTWLTTEAEYAREVEGPLHVVRDANLWNKTALLLMFLQVAWRMVLLRPDVVITTGAAPGFAAVVFGRLLGARTIWVDSIANSETLSTSGIKVGRWAHVWLTQWEHLAKPDGPQYWGAVL
jgi:UDP-N-acetylglucosamine:LPS N-acetylglucosamine transferase